MIYETNRLYTRDFKLDDFSKVHELIQSPDIYKYQSWGPNSEEDTKNFIKRSIEQGHKVPRKSFEMPIVLKETQSIIGCMRISNLAFKKADIGYWIRRDLWGKGFATEAVIEVIKFGFQELGMNKICATTAPENLASIRVLEKIGMVKKGYLKEDVYVREQYRDSVLMAILKKEFVL